MIEILQNGKEMNMYNSAINVLCDKLDSIVEGAIDIEPFSPEEALDYLKNRDSATEEEEIRYQMYKHQRGNNNN